MAFFKLILLLQVQIKTMVLDGIKNLKINEPLLANKCMWDQPNIRSLPCISSLFLLFLFLIFLHAFDEWHLLHFSQVNTVLLIYYQSSTCGKCLLIYIYIYIGCLISSYIVAKACNWLKQTPEVKRLIINSLRLYVFSLPMRLRIWAQLTSAQFLIYKIESNRIILSLSNCIIG